jgi:hypothetical protein
MSYIKEEQTATQIEIFDGIIIRKETYRATPSNYPVDCYILLIMNSDRTHRIVDGEFVNAAIRLANVSDSVSTIWTVYPSGRRALTDFKITGVDTTVNLTRVRGKIL